MYAERDRKRFKAFTEALLKAGRRHPSVHGATRKFCEAIVRVTASPPHRFDEAQSNLTHSVYALNVAIAESLRPADRQRVLRTAPSFMHDFRCAHEIRLRNVCGGVLRHAVVVWMSSRRVATA